MLAALDFLSAFVPPVPPCDTDFVFVFSDGRLLTFQKGSRMDVPTYGDVKDLVDFSRFQYLGQLNNRHCYVGDASSLTEAPPPRLTFEILRNLFSTIDDDLFWAAVRGMHIVAWDIATRFCSACGGAVSLMTEERAKRCARCERVFYPVISPAIITAIIDGNRLLLLNHQRSPENVYALLAGFVEPGETLEQCVKREAEEEAGVSVKNVTYFGSQPWSFTSSLMVGFTAQYDGGELRLQESEIRDADWFTAKDLPRLRKYWSKNGHCSIAWQMLNWFEETYG